VVTSNKTNGTIQLTLDQAELTELLQLLEHTLSETRVEVHRTHTPQFRAGVQHEAEILKSVLQKLQKARS
jgi:hypothetical protein